MNETDLIIASHQPHFFPWLGYFDKMAKANVFLINDVAQLELQSPMLRNRIIDSNGILRWINVTIDKKGYIEKENREIEITNWKENQCSLIGKIKDCYLRSAYFSQIWPMVEELLKREYNKLIELNMSTVQLGRSLLDISTPIMYQSDMTYNDGASASERLAEKLASIQTKVYLSGNGGRKYMNLDDYNKRGIKVVFQNFVYPEYEQIYGGEFIPNLSFLDLVFNCGIDKAKELFWRNVKNSCETLT